jgi:O-antigen ligase
MVLIEKLQNPLGYIFFTVFSVILAIGVAKSGLVFGILATVGVVAVPAVVALVLNAEFGIIAYISLAYAIMFLLRLGITFPLGTLMDGMLILFILGIFIQQKKNPRWELVSGPVSVWILIWIIYNFIEVANPAAESRLSWVYTVRTVAVVALSYFVFLYNIRTKAFIKTILKWWIFFSMIGAVYAFKQEFIGFFPFEEEYINSPGMPLLLFIAGHWRKFSIYSDPVTFAYQMAVASLLCIALLKGPLAFYKKFILMICCGVILVAMIFSGTRGAFPLVPAALIIYAILNYSKKILIFVIVAGVFIVGLIFLPTSNQNILRFQSAFRPNEDMSYKARKINQARIKPYVWAHPIGGGLGATGEWGKKFAPGSYLSQFPPDSGYVRVTVELGWIGLAIFCIMMFTILKTGINNYYRIRDPELKSYCLAAVLIVFAFNIANFPQEALVQFPSNVYFYLSIALMNVTYRLDQEQNLLADAHK